MSSLLNSNKPNQVSPKVSSQAVENIPHSIDYSNPENDPGLLDESELLDEVEDLESEIESESDTSKYILYSFCCLSIGTV